MGCITVCLRAAITLAALSMPAVAAEQWVSLIAGSPAGTPAELKLDEAASDSQHSTVELKIHGYFQDTIKGPDNKNYARIRVPGLPQLGIVGGPDLPTARFVIAIATPVVESKLVKMTTLQEKTSTLALVAPTNEAELDEEFDPTGDPGPGDADGTAEQWTLDPEIYKETKPWPGPPAPSAIATKLLLPAVPGAKVELLPFQWTPLTGALKILVHAKFEFAHPGTPLPFPKMTQDRAKQLSYTALNASLAKQWFPQDLAHYDSRYLIVTPQAYTDELQAFVDYRKSCGFQVTVKTLESITGGATCQHVRNAIHSWYQIGSANMDHYCLLVGDANVIPTCVSPAGDDSDDLYGSPLDGDLDEEVFVGRLSVDSATDLSNQLGKIVAYETDTNITTQWNEALLVAHKQGAPGKYEGAHESVANASYAVPPSFIKIYGSNAASTNAAVTAAINAGVGLVAYRGHGSTAAWSGWNGTNFHKNDVLALSNSQHPVVWSFTCTNQNIKWVDANSPNQDCIGEAWMETGDTGAVAHYGSTRTSGTGQNHELDRRMFEAVYDRNMVIHAQAIAWAESKMYEFAPEGQNSWRYLLLGDPAMKIRRSSGGKLKVIPPIEMAVCLPGGCDLDIVVQDALGNPVPNVLVAAFKPSSLPTTGQDEIFDNAYTDANGIAKLKAAPQSLGSIKLTARNDSGAVSKGDVLVTDGPWADLESALAGKTGEPKLVGNGTLVPGKPASLVLTNAAKNAPAVMFVSTTNKPVAFYGGTLQTFPVALVLSTPTNALGGYSLPILSWPSGIPVGTKIYFQMAIADIGAPQGVALSNAIRAKQP